MAAGEGDSPADTFDEARRTNSGASARRHVTLVVLIVNERLCRLKQRTKKEKKGPPTPPRKRRPARPCVPAAFPKADRLAVAPSPPQVKREIGWKDSRGRKPDPSYAIGKARKEKSKTEEEGSGERRAGSQMAEELRSKKQRVGWLQEAGLGRPRPTSFATISEATSLCTTQNNRHSWSPLLRVNCSRNRTRRAEKESSGRR